MAESAVVQSDFERAPDGGRRRIDRRVGVDSRHFIGSGCVGQRSAGRRRKRLKVQTGRLSCHLHGFIMAQMPRPVNYGDQAGTHGRPARLHPAPRLRESSDYELCQLSERKPGVLDELAAERARLLEKESAELEKQANRLAEEIKELAGESPGRIV